MNPRSLTSFGIVAALASLAWLVLREPAGAAPPERGPATTSAAAAARDLGPADRSELANAPIGPGYYGAPVGTRLSFALDCAFGSELVHTKNGTKADGGQFALAGSLELTILDRRSDELVASLALPGAELTSPHGVGEAAAKLDAVEAAFARPTLVRFDARGCVVGLRFAEGFGWFERSQLRALLANFRFAVPVEPASAWTLRDADDTGEFEAEYAWRDGTPDTPVRTCSRQRTKYLSVRAAERGGRCSIALRSRATGTLSREVGWLVAANVDEITVVTLEGFGADVRSTFRGTLALASAGRVSLAGTPDVAWDGPWATAVGDPAEAASIADGFERDKWQKRLDGIRVEDLADWLASLVATGQHDGDDYDRAWEEISWMVRLDPQALAKLVAMIEGGRFDEQAVSGILTAIGCADTAAAQTALTAIQANDALPTATRAAAIVALVQSTQPAPATLAALFGNAEGTLAGHELGSVSLFVLGAFAGNRDARLPDGAPALDRLLGLEPATRTRDATSSWLTALGNSGDPRIVERIAPYTSDADTKVRDAAVMALRRTPTERAHALLVEACRDPSPVVRTRAVESLAEHGTGRARATLRELAARDQDAEVRRAALLGLAQDLDAEGRAVVQRVAAGDPHAELRELANRILGA
jgi:hypothetical protein